MEHREQRKKHLLEYIKNAVSLLSEMIAGIICSLIVYSLLSSQLKLHKSNSQDYSPKFTPLNIQTRKILKYM